MNDDIKNKMLEKAILLASRLHEGQRSKDGLPYILHPLEVMRRVSSVEEKTVAVLHDVLEDTDADLELLEKHFSYEIVNAVYALTKKEDQDYNQYISLIGENPLATKVKLADLTHNMDILRLDYLTDKDLSRLNKYHRSYKYLSKVLKA